MKRVGHLFTRATSFENLWYAWHQARKGKRNRTAVIRFDRQAEWRLLELQRALRCGDWHPGIPRQWIIHERKPRLITAAPFADRIVHHALMNMMEPEIDRRLIHDCYACRVGKGAHRAVDRCQQWMQQHAFVWKGDMRRYFPSMDHALLKQKLRRIFKDDELLHYCDIIIDAHHDEPGKGLPIGNLTSQVWANLYLNDFDHELRERMGLHYLRYMDDFVVLSSSMSQLKAVQQKAVLLLKKDAMCIHERKNQRFPVSQGVDFLGYKLFLRHRLLRNDNGHYFSRQFRNMAQLYHLGKASLEKIEPSLASWIAHSSHADTWGLREVVISSVIFK